MPPSFPEFPFFRSPPVLFQELVAFAFTSLCAALGSLVLLSGSEGPWSCCPSPCSPVLDLLESSLSLPFGRNTYPGSLLGPTAQNPVFPLLQVSPSGLPKDTQALGSCVPTGHALASKTWEVKVSDQRAGLGLVLWLRFTLEFQITSQLLCKAWQLTFLMVGGIPRSLEP